MNRCVVLALSGTVIHTKALPALLKPGDLVRIEGQCGRFDIQGTKRRRI